MKALRRGALALSLGLVVAVTVAYFTRQSEAATSRDHQLTSAAELAAQEVSSLVELVEVAVLAGGEPTAVATSIGRLVPSSSVCVSNAIRIECSGERPDTLLATAELQQAVLRDGAAAGGTSDPTLSVFDRVVTIAVPAHSQDEAVGSALAAVVAVSSDDLFADFDFDFDTELWVAEAPADAGGRGEFVVTGDSRRTYAAVDSRTASLPGATGGASLVVVASAENSVSVSSDEMMFYVILGGLALLLLLLTGATSVLAHHSLIERASIDQLTRLPNRGEFERMSAAEVATAERTGVGFALLLFDLNGFKSVNDNFGHQAGDELLQVVAERLQHATRDTDMVGRWGGDEFVVLMPGVTSTEMGGRRARQMADAISGRARLDSAADAVRVKASVGVAVWPQHGVTMLELMASADGAMYHAKRHQLVAAVAGDYSTLQVFVEDMPVELPLDASLDSTVASPVDARLDLASGPVQPETDRT